MTVKEETRPAALEPRQILNRTMCRNDLLTEEANPYLDQINRLIRQLYSKRLYTSAWLGTLPRPGEGPGEPQGTDQRLDYQPLPDAADDGRLPWFLYWEIFAVLEFTRPVPGMRLLDAGGASSLFSFYLASLGHEVHSIDLNEELVQNALKVSRAMGWSNLHSYAMNMRKLDFPDQYFDAAYSICVFEHLDYPIKQEALSEIARCLKPGALLAITFDYRNPAPGVAGYGKDTRLRNRISNPEDIQRSFLETGHFELVGNQEFHDNGESYLVHPRFGGEYTFGSLFLRKVQHPTPLCEVPLPRAMTVSLPGSLLLSVIICAYKRPDLLREALTSMLEQDLDPKHFEVIVVDNNSEDSTEEVVRMFSERSPNIRYVRERKQGLSHSRNRGCDEAGGDYVIYLDDDAKAAPDYLRLVYQTIQTHQPDIMGGPVFPYYTHPKPRWFKDEYEIRKSAETTGWSTTCRVSGSSFIIKRELLKSLGMFDPDLGMVGNTVRLSEERAVLNLYRTRPKEEQKVYYHLDCKIYHHVPREKMTPRYYLKRMYVAGRDKARLEGLTRKRWGPLTRAVYVGQSLWACCVSPWRREENRRRYKQYLLERGGGFVREVGRLVGCLHRFKKERNGN